MRYHKNIYFSEQHQEDITALTYALNLKQWQYTKHCLDNVRLRVLDIGQLLYFIKNELRLNSDDVFEIYTDAEEKIVKMCYRFHFSNAYDVILVLDNEKTIITIYVNEICDKHDTLRKNNYVRV